VAVQWSTEEHRGVQESRVGRAQGRTVEYSGRTGEYSGLRRAQGAQWSTGEHRGVQWEYALQESRFLSLESNTSQGPLVCV